MEAKDIDSLVRTIAVRDDEITKLKTELQEKDEQLRWLNALEAAGIDNWEGIEIARDIMDDPIE